MIFGEKFYPSLQKLSPWRQSLFALTLTQGQYANFALFCQMQENNEAIKAFDKALISLWTFHQDKFNHIDLESEIRLIDPFIIDPEQYLGEDGEVTVGAKMAINALSSLTAAYDAIIMKEGNEAEIASKSSLSCVILACEHSLGEEMDDDTLRECELVDEEVNFQISIFECLKGAKRDLELVHFLIKLSLKEDLSNVGISFADAGLSEIEPLHYEISEEKLKELAQASSALKSQTSAPKIYGKINASLSGKKRRKIIDSQRTFRKN